MGDKKILDPWECANSVYGLPWSVFLQKIRQRFFFYRHYVAFRKKFWVYNFARTCCSIRLRISIRIVMTQQSENAKNTFFCPFFLSIFYLPKYNILFLATAILGLEYKFTSIIKKILFIYFNKISLISLLKSFTNIHRP